MQDTLAITSKCFSLLITFSLVTIVTFSNVAEAKRFASSYPCSDTPRVCQDTTDRIVTGVFIKEPCWEFGYTKTCQYPSKNNCAQYAHCYAVADLRCFLRDSIGNCVNLEKEFCCKSWDPVMVDREVARMGFVEKDGQDGLVCSGIPCIDGNCVDKSYQTNGEMADSASKLYTVSQMKGGKDVNFKIFAGNVENCSKKATNYTNCCSTETKGWGTSLGAGCTPKEKDLMEKRRNNLCVYVGKANKQTMGITTRVKHHFCCFSNMLNKVIQVEGRKQLGTTFGRSPNPDCRGFTIEELQKLDFEKMDLTEFIEDFKAKFAGKYKKPNVGDLTTRMRCTTSNIKKGDNNPSNRENNKSGFSNSIGN